MRNTQEILLENNQIHTHAVAYGGEVRESKTTLDLLLEVACNCQNLLQEILEKQNEKKAEAKKQSVGGTFEEILREQIVRQEIKPLQTINTDAVSKTYLPSGHITKRSDRKVGK